MKHIDASSIVVGLTGEQTRTFAQLLTQALLVIHTPLETVKVFEQGDEVYITCRSDVRNLKFLVRMVSGDGTVGAISLHTVTKDSITQDPFASAWFNGDDVFTSTWVDDTHVHAKIKARMKELVERT